MFSSEPAARILVNCFAFMGLTIQIVGCADEGGASLAIDAPRTSAHPVAGYLTPSATRSPAAGHQWWFHFGDLNVSQDPRAAEAVLYSGIPLTLIPFELATNLMMTPYDLELLRLGDDDVKWLSEISQHWLSYWEERLGRKGFYPFDALAVSYVATPEHFECRKIHARIGFSVFLAPFVMGRDLEVGDNLSGPSVTYCFDLDREFKGVLLTRLNNFQVRNGRTEIPAELRRFMRSH